MAKFPLFCKAFLGGYCKWARTEYNKNIFLRLKNVWKILREIKTRRKGKKSGVGPFLGFARFFVDSFDLPGSSGFVFFSLSWLIKRTCKEHSWKRPGHNQDLSPVNLKPVILKPDHEDRNLLKLRNLDSFCPCFLSDNGIWGQWTQMLQMQWSQGWNSFQDLRML